MAEHAQPSMLAIAAMLATVFGLAVAPAATAPILMLGGAVAFAGLRPVALAAIVVLVLAGVAGLRVDASSRTSSPNNAERR